MKEKGSVHLYIGKGKGKTTAAVGLAVRAKGAGKEVCFIQFLKARQSSELLMLKKLGVEILFLKERHPLFYKSASTDKLKQKILKDLKKAASIIRDSQYDIIILDEVL